MLPGPSRLTSICSTALLLAVRARRFGRTTRQPSVPSEAGGRRGAPAFGFVLGVASGRRVRYRLHASLVVGSLYGARPGWSFFRAAERPSVLPRSCPLRLSRAGSALRSPAREPPPVERGAVLLLSRGGAGGRAVRSRHVRLHRVSRAGQGARGRTHRCRPTLSVSVLGVGRASRVSCASPRRRALSLGRLSGPLFYRALAILRAQRFGLLHDPLCRRQSGGASASPVLAVTVGGSFAPRPFTPRLIFPHQRRSGFETVPRPFASC